MVMIREAATGDIENLIDALLAAANWDHPDAASSCPLDKSNYISDVLRREVG
jgi:hypothetical protein